MIVDEVGCHVGLFAVGALALDRSVLPIQLEIHTTSHTVGVREEVFAEERVTQQRQMHPRKSHKSNSSILKSGTPTQHLLYSQCPYMAILYIQSYLISFVFSQELSKLHHSSIECIQGTG